MFETVYEWVCNIWKWMCPPRSSRSREPMIVDWEADVSFPPVNAQEGPLRSNHTSDPNIIQAEENTDSGSSTGAVLWETNSSIEI